MNLAALKKEVSGLHASITSTLHDFLTLDVSKLPIIIKWQNAIKTVTYYQQLDIDLKRLSDDKHKAVVRYLSRNDLFFLLWYTLNRRDALHQWLIDRAWEVQQDPNSYLDLWAREHYKSTIITYALTIQDILSSHGLNPHPKWKGREVTVGIFSCTRPIAKAFLAQIKREFESNEDLKYLFSDVLWDNPTKDAPKWSEDAGLVVKRQSNPKEETIEAWGVVEGQPTSKHFLICVYDDLVTKDHVQSPYMIKKVIESWEVSTNLGTEGGAFRYVGTRYHPHDPYATMIKRNAVKVRLYMPTHDGSLTDNPVLKSKEELEDKLRRMGTYTYGCQMMQNPLIDKSNGFKLEWLQKQTVNDWSNLNLYILVDPANEKKESSDYTSMFVVGVGEDQNYYVLDMVRDRLNLGERAEMLLKLHRKYKPLKVGYERYGMQSDIFYINEQQKKQNYNFKVYELGGNLNKFDRIRKLIPLFENGRIYLPEKCIRTNYNNVTEDLVQVFTDEEFYPFPVSLHDDMLDALARILDAPKEDDPDKHNKFFVVFPNSESGVDISQFINKVDSL